MPRSGRIAVLSGVMLITGGVAAMGAGWAGTSGQPASELPDGFTREGGDIVDRRGTLIVGRFSEPAQIVERLPISSFKIDKSGAMRSFTIRETGPSPFDIPVTAWTSSVTIGADGRLLGMTFADDDSGCDMTVEVGEDGSTHYSCDETTCTTVCDVVMTSGDGGPPYTIKCECRPE